MEINAIPGDAPASFYLQAGLTLPDDHKVRIIAFYGDNGNSSLSLNLDIDAVTNEGRQSLGLIVERKEDLPDGAEELHQELWLFKYDDILFQKFDFTSSSDKKIRIAGVDFSRDNCIHLQPLESSDDVDDLVMVPKSKLVSCTCSCLVISIMRLTSTLSVTSYIRSTYLHSSELPSTRANQVEPMRISWNSWCDFIRCVYFIGYS